MRSSGTLAYTRDEPLSCPACDWSGWVETHIDPEINLLAWHCPSCTTDHEEDWR